MPLIGMKKNTPELCLWTLSDTAQYIGCTVRHVQNLMRAGLPNIKLGRLVRFDPEEVKAFLKKHRCLSVTP